LRVESRLAVAAHFGVSRSTIARWCRALGIVLVETEGTRRQRKAANQASGLRQRGAGWTADEETLLGTITDATAAERLGRSRDSVRYRRVALGISPARPNAPPLVWTAKMDAQLGTATDTAIGKRIGRSKLAVSRRRRKLGIVAFTHR
jgi:hypothetical protein